MTVPFVAFAFPATGTPTNRTTPDRLAEVKNVKDFGAVGDGIANDRAAIQAAVDWTSGADRGTIYFPAGGYLVDAPITFNYDGPLSICFRGESGSTVHVTGTFDGFIFDRHLPTATVTISIASPGVVTDTAHGKSTNDPLRFETTGALPTGLTKGTTYYVKTVLSANTYTVSATAGGTVIATTGSQSGSHTRAALNTSGGRIFERMKISATHANGGCIRLGSTIGGVIRDCQLSGHTCITTEDAVGVSSKNTLIQTASFSLGTGAESGAHYIIIGGGGSIQNCGLVGTDTAVRAYGSGLHASGNRQERNNKVWLLGLDSADNAVGLSGFSITSSTFEGNLKAFHFAGPCDGFYIGSHGIQGHDSSNSGSGSSATGTLSSIEIDADCAKNGVIEAISIGSWHEDACVKIANATSRTNLLVRNIQALHTGGGGVDWTLPTNAYTALFENVNTPVVWTYAQLPTGGNVLEGDEFDISDSNTATWGATVAGSSSNRVRVRFNGTDYTVVGK